PRAFSKCCEEVATRFHRLQCHIEGASWTVSPTDFQNLGIPIWRLRLSTKTLCWARDKAKVLMIRKTMYGMHRYPPLPSHDIRLYMASSFLMPGHLLELLFHPP